MKILAIGKTLLAKTRMMEYLRQVWMVPDYAASIEEGAELSILYPYDVIILEDDVDPERGVSCLRKKGINTPILVISLKASVEVRTRALEVGADDYLVKPVHYAEVAARLRAVSRRSTGHASSDVVLGNLVIRLEQAGFVWVKGNRIRLPKKTFYILKLFMRWPGKVFTRTQIIAHIYSGMVDADERTIDVHMGRLRRELKNASGGIDYFETVRGIGYILSVPTAEAKIF